MDQARKIFINGRYLTQRMTGAQRYSAEVVQALDRLLDAGTLGSGHRVVLLAPRGSFQLPALKSIQMVQGGAFSGHLWEQIDLPRLARGGLLFNPCGPSPLAHPRQVTTIHDASPFLSPEVYSFPYRTWTCFLHLSAGLRARAVLTVSNYSKKRLLERCRTLSSEKIHVVYGGSDHILRGGYDASILNDLFGDTRHDYVLCVGSQQANKNVKIVASVSEWLEQRGIATVITGGGNRALFRGGEKENAIIKTGYVTDSQLRALYQNARCFIFPSLEEGFGIPPLEAMRCQCPVLSSSNASMPEICGDTAIYFEPESVDDLKAALNQVLSTTAMAEELKVRGRLQAEKYTWDRTALGVWSYLQRESGT